MSINKEMLGITSILAYALATYVMVAPAFTVNQFNLPEWLAFLIVSMPFAGRIVGSFLYQRVISFLGSRLTYLFSLIALGLLSVGSSVNVLGVLIPLRLLIGIFFGIITSLAIEQAVRSGSRLIIALTMSGWAFGWIGGALSYITLQQWSLIALSGIVTLPFSLLYNNVTTFSTERTKFTVPSISSVLAFFFSFEPSFALQLAPAMVEDEGGIFWLIMGYIVSLFMYVLVPVISNFLGESKTVLLCTTSSAMSGVLFFLTASPYILVAFTAFGLGMNSIAPRIASAYGVTPRNMGVALNTAAVGGVIVPILGSLDIKVFASLFTAISMIVLLIMGIRKTNAIAVQVAA